MKIRQGFVSNSSSSSFLISKKDLTVFQLDQIKDHTRYIEKCEDEDGIEWSDDSWSVDEENFHVEVSTFMDNFDMYTYLVDVVGIPEDKIKRGEL